MTIEQAIKHYREEAEELRETAKSYPNYEPYDKDHCACLGCANEREQLANWLEELRGLRLLVNWAVDCGFGYDNISDLYERYADEIKDMSYTEGLVYIATKQANQVEPLVQRSEEE